jgi:hypothetical protein
VDLLLRLFMDSPLVVFCYLPTYIPTTLYIRMQNGELEMIGYSGQTFWMPFLVAIYSGLCRPLLLVIWPLIRFELRRLNIMMAVFFQIHFGKRCFTKFFTSSKSYAFVETTVIVQELQPLTNIFHVRFPIVPFHVISPGCRLTADPR